MQKIDIVKFLQTLANFLSRKSAKTSNVLIDTKKESIKVLIPETKPINSLQTEPAEQKAQVTIKDKKFLICPIQGKDENGNALTARTIRISAILDHSGTAIDPNSSLSWGKSAKDQKVAAFNGEIGEGVKCPTEPCGYPKKEFGDFFRNKEINYVGVSSDGGKSVLQYDGHAGYDFPYPLMTPVLAPAGGKLYKAAKGKDAIYGGMWGSETNNYKLDNSFYIEHDNGFITWFRHCIKLHDNIEQKIGSNFSTFYSVEKGQIIAYVGKIGTASVHLHFEVRKSEGNITDPYSDGLWED